MPSLILLGVLAHFRLASAQSTGNHSIESPQVPGFFYQDNCKIICQRATWITVLIFFLGNYVAHAATITERPGQGKFVSAINAITALLFPGAGIWRGLRVISSLAQIAPTSLQAAARAGALYAVIRETTRTDMEAVAFKSPFGGEANAETHTPETGSMVDVIRLASANEAIVPVSHNNTPIAEWPSQNTSARAARAPLAAKDSERELSNRISYKILLSTSIWKLSNNHKAGGNKLN